MLYPLEVTTDDKRNTGSLSGGKEIDAPRSAFWILVVIPASTVIGNSRPFEPWMVMIRTLSSSVSGNTVSDTRALSAP